MIRLSQRLSIALSFLKDTTFLADIGTDHGYFPIEAVRLGLVKRAIATDNKLQPLQNAQMNIQSAHLCDQIETRLMDGITGLPIDVDTISLLGMGGELIVRILSKGNLSTIQHLILGPHSKSEKVRLFLQNHQFHIIDEAFILDKGTYYHIISATKGEMNLSSVEARYGRLNLLRKNELLKGYINDEINRLILSLPLVKTSSGRLKINEKIKEMRGIIHEWY